MKKIRQRFHKITYANRIKNIKARKFSGKDLKLDKKGFFLIKLEGNHIKVAFCTYNFKITKVITSNNAQDLYKEIIKRNIVSSLQHAAYLGYELEKAEYALKHKQKYIQG
ncbi:MAG TPA: DUF4346 domain-containing protein [Candidatus Nanoarchaeia archaeon]|nr:DUF4346 domain-containing protein [Candidatus Nanoarchaeia archaeon]